MAIETTHAYATWETLPDVVAEHAAEGYQSIAVNHAIQFDDEAGTELVVFFGRKVGWVAPVVETPTEGDASNEASTL